MNEERVLDIKTHLKRRFNERLSQNNRTRTSRSECCSFENEKNGQYKPRRFRVDRNRENSLLSETNINLSSQTPIKSIKVTELKVFKRRKNI